MHVLTSYQICDMVKSTQPSAAAACTPSMLPYRVSSRRILTPKKAGGATAHGMAYRAACTGAGTRHESTAPHPRLGRHARVTSGHDHALLSYKPPPIGQNVLTSGAKTPRPRVRALAQSNPRIPLLTLPNSTEPRARAGRPSASASSKTQRYSHQAALTPRGGGRRPGRSAPTRRPWWTR